MGARDSDYLAMLEKNPDDHSLAVIMVDPLPDSFIPLQKRAATYAMNSAPMPWLNPSFLNHAFVVPAALGETEGVTNFHLAPGPACGSILQSSKTTKFFCAKTTSKKQVLLFTLYDLLSLIPTTITDLHLKVDAEGADLIVLKGAGSSIRRFQTVIHECQNLRKGDPELHRAGGCLWKEAREYMCKQGFCSANWIVQSPTQGNGFYRQDPKTAHIPELFETPDVLAFAEEYKKARRESQL